MNKGEDSKGRNPQKTQERRPVSREERMRRKRERLKRKRRILIAMMCAALVVLILIVAGIVALVRHFTGNNNSEQKAGKQASDLTIEEQKAEKEKERGYILGGGALGAADAGDPFVRRRAHFIFHLSLLYKI